MSSVQHVDECAVRWWRGYVKSCFFVVVDSDAPADGILMSPLFWSVRKSSLTAEGPIAAAHQQLVEKLQRQGWQPAGVGAVWYEQRFLRTAHELTAAETAPPILEAPPKPARPVEAYDRPQRAGTRRAPASAAAATTPAQGSLKPSSPAKLHEPAPRVRKKPTNARGRRGAPPAHGPAIPRAARTARVGNLHRVRPSRRPRQLVRTGVVVGRAAVAAAEVAALLTLTGS